MNRRSFFGFACGGIIAAPVVALTGECPSNGRLALTGDIGPELVGLPKGLPVHTIEISASSNVHIRAMVEQGIEVAMRSHQDQMRRGGIGAQQARYSAMKG